MVFWGRVLRILTIQKLFHFSGFRSTREIEQAYGDVECFTRAGKRNPREHGQMGLIKVSMLGELGNESDGRNL